jgi:hypothetical protein
LIKIKFKPSQIHFKKMKSDRERERKKEREKEKTKYILSFILTLCQENIQSVCNCNWEITYNYKINTDIFLRFNWIKLNWIIIIIKYKQYCYLSLLAFQRLKIIFSLNIFFFILAFKTTLDYLISNIMFIAWWFLFLLKHTYLCLDERVEKKKIFF